MPAQRLLVLGESLSRLREIGLAMGRREEILQNI
jgi:hypothetical protein